MGFVIVLQFTFYNPANWLQEFY